MLVISRDTHIHSFPSWSAWTHHNAPTYTVPPLDAMSTTQVLPEVPPKDPQDLQDPKQPLPAHTNGADNSGWDIPEEGISKRRHIHLGLGASSTRWAIADRFDRILPPHRRYLGRSRRTFLIAIAILLLCLLALIIGLAVGLTKKNSGSVCSIIHLWHLLTFEL